MHFVQHRRSRLKVVINSLFGFHAVIIHIGHTFRILVLAIMKLSDQDLNIALEEFERTMVDVSELFLPLLENRLDRTTICAAVESGVMRFAMFV